MMWELLYQFIERSSYRPIVMVVRWLMTAETGKIFMTFSLSSREHDDLVVEKRGAHVRYFVQKPNADEIAVT
ncbi:hypothetical protein FOQG_08540 [Fusarium oxysporum f. sp. raphani 54005]|jgi:hypothetical protein|uniref:Uncharacterized protein n=4 Tax=Fusarium oxysporum TaxID=5507 RepID=X0C1W8_FUSOX|nr:hypothetical protein FOVG_01024 [Fusarium oxysporum f. sp. pisi HDV247]EXK88146.1 hypothetical protein FOQG_08540 [Fusarium oxysporum f. sp. raphani 54005]EXL74986.1 hypothetical protein FOPG_09946 [Fusarium oxysporum f. sp. conglutinans race 2 54008]EXM24121.1 hypothetical protein FOTG_08630 [Fusarium oxysporum f. sp. vasinfectum 25433]